MFKILSIVVLLGLCVSVAHSGGSSATPTSQANAVFNSDLYSNSVKVYSGANTTDSATWSNVGSNNVIFGPGSTNSTIYVYGFVSSGSTITKMYTRTLNATIVAWGNDTSEASVIGSDVTTTTSFPSTYIKAVGPGCLAVIAAGSDGFNNQVYANLQASGQSSLTQTKLTAIADITVGITTTLTTFGLGNIWYDIGSAAFFFTYYKLVKSTTNVIPTYVYTIYLGGMYANGSAYWSSPLAINQVTTSNQPVNLYGGVDNWLNSSNIYVVWKDTTASPHTTYYSKITKSTSTTAPGQATVLVADTSKLIYAPIGVWASNNTYGIACSLTNSTSGTNVYTIANFLNGTTTGTDSGITYASTSTGALALWGWMLNTGYTLLASWYTSTSNSYAYTMGTFYANGTVNMSDTTLATSLQGPLNTFEDINGANWIWWTDVDTTNQVTYNGYLAKLQGQLNASNVLTTFGAFVALFLAAIFVF